MNKIVIVGSGGYAKEIAFLIEEINSIHKKWNLLGYINQNVGERIGNYKVYQTDEWLLNCEEEVSVVIGIGVSEILEKLAKKFSQNKRLKFPSLIHPNVTIDRSLLKLGKGNVICASCSLTSEISIGKFNLINQNCTIAHDTVIGDFNLINPSATISGSVKLGNKILVGAGSVLLQNIRISSGVTIGAGAVVTRNLREKAVYVGCPAKKVP